MNNNKQYKINSHNEWDKLREIIVGTARNTNATLTWNSNTQNDPKNLSKL